MADLLDIAPSAAVGIVNITGKPPIDVRALSGNEIAAIAMRFPNLIPALVVVGDNPIGLISSIGVAIGAIIAAGCNHPGDENAERIAGSFLVEDQIKLYKAIVGLTFPNGAAPVMEAIASLMTGATGEAQPVRVRLKKSPLELQPSSDADSPQIIQ